MSEPNNPYRAPSEAKSTDEPLIRIARRKPIPWLAAFTSSAAAVYGPYAVMTLYTQAYVSCDHCKQATRNLLACAPGLLPVELIQRGLGIPHQSDWIWFSFAAAFAILWVLGFTFVLRRSWLLGVTGAVLTIAISSWLAFVLLSMIRM
jgi:hypothetical protein